MPRTHNPADNNRGTINAPNIEPPKCGIIMPISALDTYSSAHWEEVKVILKEAITSAGFQAELVSEAEDSTIIQKTIVQNLYNNEIVVCDISGKNPNVMFELGIRLTFDKPTIVVKDDDTDYSFDTSPIEHVGYPRGLNYHQIVQFKTKLAAKAKATYEAGKNPNYSTFLKHFGQFTVPKLEQQEISSEQFVIQRLTELTNAVSRLERASRSGSSSPENFTRHYRFWVSPETDRDIVDILIAFIKETHSGARAKFIKDSLNVWLPDSVSKGETDRILDLVHTSLRPSRHPVDQEPQNAEKDNVDES